MDGGEVFFFCQVHWGSETDAAQWLLFSSLPGIDESDRDAATSKDSYSTESDSEAGRPETRAGCVLIHYHVTGQLN